MQRVGFGNRLALRARTSGARAGIRVDMGQARVDDAAPAAGIVARVRFAVGEQVEEGVDLVDFEAEPSSAMVATTG